MKLFTLSLLAFSSFVATAYAAVPVFVPSIANIQGGSPTSVVVCVNTCAKSNNAKDYKVNFGPMPAGQFQVNGLSPGKYEAGVPGVGFKFYSVAKDGILNGYLNAIPQGALRNKVVQEYLPFSSDKQYAWCSSTACYKNVWLCGAEPGVKLCKLQTM